MHSTIKLLDRSDWLSTNTIFFNNQTSAISNNINEVIDFNQFEWDINGLHNYLNFGYCVFGRTPVKNVNFLPPDSELIIDVHSNKINGVTPTNTDDSIIKILDDPTEPSDVIELITSELTKLDNETSTSVVLPLSGGYDSRMLAALFPDKSKLQCFTYSVLENPESCQEVINARYISNNYNIFWKQIQLGNYHSYLNEWYNLFGVSMHAHGMYHMDFYTKLMVYANQVPLISGIIGDAWAGSLEIPSISSPNELLYLGLNHGLHANSDYCELHLKDNQINEKYFEQKKGYLTNPRFRIIEAMRIKMILLKYLIQIPQSLDFKPFTPFLKKDIALAMLRLPDKERFKRKWQKDYFQQIGLELEHITSPKFSVDLHTHTINKYKLPPLSEEILKEIINKKYVNWINNHINFTSLKLKKYKIHKRLSKSKFIWHFLPKIYDTHLTAYFAYLTLYPLQQMIITRDRFLKGQ